MIPPTKKYNYDFLNTADWYKKELANPLLQKMATNWLRARHWLSNDFQTIFTPEDGLPIIIDGPFLSIELPWPKVFRGEVPPIQGSLVEPSANNLVLSQQKIEHGRRFWMVLDPRIKKKTSNRFNVGIHGYGICKLSDFSDSSTINETLQDRFLDLGLGSFER